MSDDNVTPKQEETESPENVYAAALHAANVGHSGVIAAFETPVRMLDLMNANRLSPDNSRGN